MATDEDTSTRGTQRDRPFQDGRAAPDQRVVPNPGRECIFHSRVRRTVNLEPEQLIPKATGRGGQQGYGAGFR